MSFDFEARMDALTSDADLRDPTYETFYRQRALIEQMNRRRKSFELVMLFCSSIALTLGGTLLTLYFADKIALPKPVFITSGLMTAISVLFVAFRFLEPVGITSAAEAFIAGAQKFAPIGRISFGVGAKASPTGTGVAELQDQVNKLVREVARIKTEHKSYSYDNVVDRLQHQVFAGASQDLVSEVEKRVQLIERTDLYDARHAMKIVTDTVTRINDALIKLGRRGAINLLLGALITAAGAGMLCFFVLGDVVDFSNPTQYAMHFIPRLAIVALIQVFALFFLKLYKVGLEEIKFFQNELTTIEQRHLALSVALLQDDHNIRNDILEKIAGTDRNNILEKGQTTVELERSRLESGGGAIDALRSIIPLIQKTR